MCILKKADIRNFLQSSQSKGSPVISSRQGWGWNRLGLVLPPHQILQLAELVPEVGVGGRDGLGDGGVDVGDPGLRASTQVSIAWIVSLRGRTLGCTYPSTLTRSCPRTWLSGWEECCGCKDPETSSAWQNIYHLSISRLSFVRLPFRWEQYRGLRSVPGQRYNMTCLCFLYTIDGSLSCQIRPYPSLVSSQSLSAKIIILRRYMSEIASFQRKLVSISKTEVPTSFNQKSIKVCRTKIISQY